MQQASDVATYTCICCPLGCQVEVTFAHDGSVSEVAGHTCKRGADYAASEATCPMRMVTAVIPVAGCLEPVSVKTQNPVPKARMHEVLDALRACSLEAPLRAGQVIVEDAGGTGVAVVATKDVP